MSIFSQNNFGLSKSLIDAVKTVNEGKQKYRVSAQKGSLAARFLKDAETTLFAKDEKDAANRVMADFKMKGVTQNDLKVTREEFEHANLDEAVQDQINEAMPDQFNTHDKVRVKDTTNPRIKKFSGKEATVTDIEDGGKTVHAKVKGARHGSMEFKASELEKV